MGGKRSMAESSKIIFIVSSENFEEAGGRGGGTNKESRLVTNETCVNLSCRICHNIAVEIG